MRHHVMPLPPFELLEALDHAETGHRLAGDRIGHTPRDHQPRVQRHDVLLIRGGQGYGFHAHIPIFKDMDEHGVARGTCPGEAPCGIGLSVPGGAPCNLGLSPDPEQRVVPAPRTDLQVGAGDGLAGPVYDPDTECARLSQSDDRRLHLSSIRDVNLPKLGAETLGLRRDDRRTRLTTSEGVLPEFVGRHGRPLVPMFHASGVDLSPLHGLP